MKYSFILQITCYNSLEHIDCLSAAFFKSPLMSIFDLFIQFVEEFERITYQLFYVRVHNDVVFI